MPFITKTAYEQEVPLSLKNSETTTPYPSDWFNDERISNRKKITDLAFKNSQVQKLDLSKKEDIKVTKQTTEKEEEQPKKRTSKTRRTKKNNDQGVK